MIGPEYTPPKGPKYRRLFCFKNGSRVLLEKYERRWHGEATIQGNGTVYTVTSGAYTYDMAIGRMRRRLAEARNPIIQQVGLKLKHVEQGGTGPIVVRFPDPHDSTYYREATFAPNGTILGDGPQVLFRVKTQTEALDEICRDLSCRIEKVDIRLENSKTQISEADESTGESLDW